MPKKVKKKTVKKEKKVNFSLPPTREPIYLNRIERFDLNDIWNSFPMVEDFFNHVMKLGNLRGIEGWQYVGCSPEYDNPSTLEFQFRKSFTQD